MVKILLDFVFLAVVFETSLGQEFVDLEGKSDTVKYYGPAVYSNLPPPILYYPAYPDEPEMRDSNIDVHKINSLNSPVEYIPYPDQNVPVLVYQSSTNSPIHVIQKQDNPNLEEMKNTDNLNAKAPVRDIETPETVKQGIFSAMTKKPQINITLNHGESDGRPHITVKVTPNVEVSENEMDGKRVINIGIASIAASTIPQEDVLSNSGDKNFNSEQKFSEMEQTAQMSADDIQHTAYDSGNAQFQVNNGYYDKNQQGQGSYGFDQAQYYHNAMQSENQGNNKFEEKEGGKRIDQNLPIVVHVLRGTDQNYGGMMWDMRPYPFSTEMPRNQRQVQMSESQMTSNYDGPHHDNSAIPLQNQRQKSTNAGMEPLAVNGPLNFLNNEKYRHIVIHIPYRGLDDHPPQNQQEKKQEAIMPYTGTAQAFNAVGNVGRNMKKSMTRFQNQIYNAPVQVIPLPRQRVRNEGLRVEASTPFKFEPNALGYHQEFHSYEPYVDLGYGFSDFITLDQTSAGSRVIVNDFILPHTYGNMIPQPKLHRPQHVIPMNMGRKKPRKSLLRPKSLLPSSSNIKFKMANLFKRFRRFSRFGDRKRHIAKRDTSLKTMNSRLNSNPIFMPTFENLFKRSGDGAHDLSFQSQHSSPISYQYFSMPVNEQQFKAIAISNLKYDGNNSVNKNDRKTSTPIHDGRYNDYESHELFSTLATSLSQQHKPPIIIYKGINPLVHNYGDPSDIEKPRSLK